MIILAAVGILGGVVLFIVKMAVGMVVRIGMMAAAGVIALLVIIWILGQG